MEIKELLSEERAVSPVIGVILMVAITVILAAVIGTFVLGLGQNVQSTPSASFSFDFNESGKNVTVTHTGGDQFNSDNTENLTITGDSTSPASFSLPVSAGTSKEYSYSNPGETIRVVWSSPDGGKTAVVASQQAPA